MGECKGWINVAKVPHGQRVARESGSTKSELFKCQWNVNRPPGGGGQGSSPGSAFFSVINEAERRHCCEQRAGQVAVS